MPSVLPAAPTAVHAVTGSTTTTTGPLTVTFTLGAGNGTPITNNTATCTSSNGGATKTASHATSPITVAGATTGKTYTCKVTSTNGVGTGPSSATSPSVIVGSPAPPTTVSATPQYTTAATGSFKVTFVGGATNGSTLTGPAQYTATCVSSNGGTTESGSGPASPITVAGATTAKAYTCTVKAHNARGFGAASAASAAVTVGAPARVSQASVTKAASGVLTVSYPLLTVAQANGNTLTAPKYTASCVSSNGGVAGSATGSGSSINVTGLSAGKTYTCTVKAHNDAVTADRRRLRRRRRREHARNGR